MNSISLARRIATGQAFELEGRELHDALVDHFGFEDIATEPMPLEELPSTRGTTLVEPSDAEIVNKTLAPRRHKRNR